ncbi:alcohol dehydrogenase catalytic domain-containing protein [Actinomadura parmotrematis]|uniref:Alcohol dehydrogenase catalytic domain-containing protein n=1 Tax=Actinomadura parmotrematis TaxID=2864039 RepID=A0ABS7G4L5_9ACTN|nr:alcohol dehydrogenase catalytic domain-containing protein [Actinomadura parmotrematis]MBW8487664.1 alcohol dehydrogenase catalytic domain-containing protein [Actinomadura parmotrematis]
MRAVVYEAFGGAPEVREVPDPAVPAGGAVVRVEATGLCRSDWHGWQGHDADIAAFPHVPGHELAGVVAETGAGVTRWRAGDRVTVPFVCACGRCASCAAGDQQVCEAQTQPGFTHWGSFAEYVALHQADANLVAVPEGMAAATAASLGCRFATAYRAVLDQGGARPGRWVAVHGCGGVGLSAVMIAAAAGARVVAVDVAPAALDLARSVGAEAAVDARAGGTAAAVREITGGGAHLSLDALGDPATAAASVASLRRRGRHVQVGLLPSAAGRADLPMDLVVARELEIVGSHGMAAHAYGPMLAQVAAGTLRPDRLLARTIGLAEAPAALAAMAGPGVTMIDPAR